jgi:hypothetical protein
MAAPSLDNEFMQYWSKLTIVEKESLMNVAKNYVKLKEGEDISDARKKLIQAERSAYLNGGGKSFTWEQVKDMTLNKDRRNAL